ncbi:hypothetical protein [Arthrobacter sp. GMC3]|uniref:hypothetical protein n=1 Tax=Arthrobacter sp. GMC3 TaxID=2058894 RepID=UPI000CE5537C|nr:hypothetical protein [Arthrobacter sp. GMC3]
MNTYDATNDKHNPAKAEGGYGAPVPEDELPDGADTNPGSPDPTLRGQEGDVEALTSDESLGVPEKNFFDKEDAGSDGEPGAGRLGGTDEQFHDELATADADEARVDPRDETPVELPSSEAPMDDGNTERTRDGRESFSSESDAEAGGDDT